MKYFILAALLIGSTAQAYVEEQDTDELVCAKNDSSYSGNARSISCVSKASIELDKAQLKLVRLQIRKLEAEIKLMEETGQIPTTKKSGK